MRMGKWHDDLCTDRNGRGGGCMHTVLAAHSLSSYIKLETGMYTWAEQDLAVMENGLFLNITLLRVRMET